MKRTARQVAAQSMRLPATNCASGSNSRATDRPRVHPRGCAVRFGAGRCSKGAKVMEKDPVCGMQVDPGKAAAKRQYQGKTYYFCSPGCAARFDQKPEQCVNADTQGKGSRSEN
jgi:YHS domain-containing protein